MPQHKAQVSDLWPESTEETINVRGHRAQLFVGKEASEDCSRCGRWRSRSATGVATVPSSQRCPYYSTVMRAGSSPGAAFARVSNTHSSA